MFTLVNQARINIVCFASDIYHPDLVSHGAVEAAHDFKADRWPERVTSVMLLLPPPDQWAVAV